MRRTIGALALMAGLALLLATTGPAYADPGQDPPGFNGTIKVHDGDGEAEPIVRNEPHVGCDFHLHGFNFDGEATGTWRIVAWPPTGDGSSVAADGDWTADGSGEWRTEVMSLDDGHYKVFSDQEGAPGDQKHKVFWVECEVAAEEDEEEVVTSRTTPTPTPTVAGVQQPPAGVTQPVGEVRGAPAVGQVTQPEAQPAPLAAPAALPSTSTAAPGASALSLALLVLGGALLRRRDR